MEIQWFALAIRYSSIDLCIGGIIGLWTHLSWFLSTLVVGPLYLVDVSKYEHSSPWSRCIHSLFNLSCVCDCVIKI